MLEEHIDTSGKVLGLQLKIKVVPGSSRDQIAGRLGDRLKIKVAAAPEKGKANQAVIALIAQTLQIAERDIQVISGHTSPEKTVFISGISLKTAASSLSLP